MRLCPGNNVYGQRFASHPQQPGVCVRIDGSNALIMWNGDHMQAPIEKIPTSWWSPTDKSGRRVPMRIRRPLFGAKYNTLDVEFLAVQEEKNQLPSGTAFWGPFALNLLMEFSKAKKRA